MDKRWGHGHHTLTNEWLPLLVWFLMTISPPKPSMKLTYLLGVDMNRLSRKLTSICPTYLLSNCLHLEKSCNRVNPHAMRTSSLSVLVKLRSFKTLEPKCSSTSAKLWSANGVWNMALTSLMMPSMCSTHRIYDLRTSRKVVSVIAFLWGIEGNLPVADTWSLFSIASQVTFLDAKHGSQPPGLC